ncbi:MAG: hypothetical protein LBD31_07315 [Treponema sp.]|jgi:hypothetical protein|nr:hypothetical protein [Treponema sp.]
MANVPFGPAQYLTRFSEQSISCNHYVLAKLGIDRSRCSLKIEDYVILCMPFQFGFKRSILMAPLSKEELVFFQKYENTTVNLSITFIPAGRIEPIHFFIHCSLTKIGQMKNRENVGLFVVDYKNTPDELVMVLGDFLDGQEKLLSQYEDYADTPIRVTPDTSRALGYNMYSVICDSPQGRRIQVLSLSSKNLEHLEAAGAPVRAPGTAVQYQLFFKKYRVSARGRVERAAQIPQGIIQTVSQLHFCPELVEVIDDYWLNVHSNPKAAKQ